jgi:RNA-directed DNA polymerase
MDRLSACKLKLNEEKTHIVYCKDSGRRGNHENVSFDFLGYTIQPRKSQNRQTKKIFTSFLPAISQKSKNHIHETIRGWPLRNKKNLTELDSQMEASACGWINLREILPHSDENRTSGTKSCHCPLGKKKICLARSRK